MGDTTGAKTVVVTGGNAGLGYECAKGIAGTGRECRVVLAIRSHEKGERAARAIAKETGNPNVEAMGLDLASLASVRSFARELVRRNDLLPIRALVCNAGLQVVSGTTYTEDGFEESFGVNHLAHFLLVNLVLCQLEAPARIVFVSSGTHDPERRTGMPAPRYRGARALAYPERYPDPEEGREGPGKLGRRRYTASKLCNAMCAYELDRRLRAGGLYHRGPDRRERLRPGRCTRHRSGAQPRAPGPLRVGQGGGAARPDPPRLRRPLQHRRSLGTGLGPPRDGPIT